MIMSRACINGDVVNRFPVDLGTFYQDASATALAAVQPALSLSAILVMAAQAAPLAALGADALARRGLAMAANADFVPSASLTWLAVILGGANAAFIAQASIRRLMLLSGTAPAAITARLALSYKYLRPTAVQRIFAVLDHRKTFIDCEERHANVSPERRGLIVPADREADHEY